jgi:hypothetical protein
VHLLKKYFCSIVKKFEISFSYHSQIEDGSNYNYSTIEEIKPSEVILEPTSSSS